MKIAIVGAAGNLGSLLARGMMNMDMSLNLLIHENDVSDELKQRPNTQVFRVDLGRKNTLIHALWEVDTVVYFARALFSAHLGRFNPQTNLDYFNNFLSIATQQCVKRIVLISLPHVDGETVPDSPGEGKLSGFPNSEYAQIRLKEEVQLFKYAQKHNFEAVSLRMGTVYGRGVAMTDAALWCAKRNILGIWWHPTYIHLISKDDFVAAVVAAATKANVSGVYYVGDEGVQTLQDFLDDVMLYKQLSKPWRLPIFMLKFVAYGCELYSFLLRKRTPLTVEFISLAMDSYYGDTQRMREELLPELKFRTYKDGLSLF